MALNHARSPHGDLIYRLMKTISLDDCSTKILGLNWLPHGDKFTFLSKFTSPSSKLMKRITLFEVAQIFNPLGFISPVVMRAKILLQELWSLKLKWDDPMPSQIITRWPIIREDLTCVARLSITR